jgi:hypothetical protein
LLPGRSVIADLEKFENPEETVLGFTRHLPKADSQSLAGGLRHNIPVYITGPELAPLYNESRCGHVSNGTSYAGGQ